MNTNNITQLITFLEQLPSEQFDMACWVYEDHRHACGTVACIGGWAEHLARKEDPDHEEFDDAKMPRGSAWIMTTGSS